MTGLDQSADALIEVAVVVTDYELRPLGGGVDVLIRPPAAALERMSDFVRDMHTKSGLLDDLKDGVTMEEATERVLSYIKRFVPEAGKALLAGNSVGTDKMFLEANMPAVIDHLHYRLIDVSSIKELAKRWYRAAFAESPDKHGGHRALADILESIQELEYYRRVLFPAEPVTTERAREVAREVVALGIPAMGEAAKAFIANYEAAYGATPDQFAADAYDAMYTLYAATKAAGVTADTSTEDACEMLVAAMKDLKINGVTGMTGEMTWNENGEVNKAPIVVKIVNGAYVTVE